MIRENDIDMRTALSRILCDISRNNSKVIWLDSDLMASSGISSFKKEFPENVINCGIQEANMFGVAAGLSEEGLIPFVHSFAAFASRRIADQIFVSGIYAKQNVRIIGSDPGIAAGPNGGTHISLEDIGILRSMPGTIILDPCDSIQLDSVISAAIKDNGIYYIRLMRKSKTLFYSEDESFEVGKAKVYRPGNDLTIITAGTICMNEAIKAADTLEKSGISVRIVDMFTIKPIDREAVISSALETKAVISLENHNIFNGLGSAVAEVIAEEGISVPFKRLGAPDSCGEVGSLPYLLKKFGMDSESVCTEAYKLLKIH